MNKTNKILHISTYASLGGAAIAALRLSNALRQLGCDSFLLVRDAPDSMEGVQVFRPAITLPYRVSRFVRRYRIRRDFASYEPLRHSGLELFSDDRTEFGPALAAQLPDCDIVNLHWVCGLVDLQFFFRDWTKPVVWTLHDMNSFTGGCHYDNGCGRYLDQCGLCPQLSSDRERDLSRSIWKRKARAYGNLPADRLHLVAPSRWLANIASASPLLGRFPVSVIPNGVDTTVFSPRSALGLRESFGIPDGTPVLLFVADNAANQRKGFSYLADALQAMDRRRIFCLVSMGGDQPRLPEERPHIHLGRVEDENMLAAVYSLADIFVIPSVQDNLPNTTIESIACGTPVVGFRVGGISEVVRDGLTGLLVEAGDVRALRDAIQSLLGDEQKRLRLAESCRSTALAEYTRQIQATQYAELYKEIMNRAG